MYEKQNQEDNKPPSGIINKLKKYFRNPFFIKTQSVSEVTEFLKDAVDQKIIDKEAESIASKAIRLGDITVKEIMIPKVDMVTIQVKDDTNEIIKRIIESGHSRYPVLGEERNEVAGILLAKDILPKLFKGTADFDINEMLRDPNVVPETKKADSLLEEFKQDRSHLAVVIDEYGEICGLITIEDILEELVGEIEDEFYEEKNNEIIKINDKEFIVSSTIEKEKFEEFFSFQLNCPDVETLGGFVLKEIGHLPKVGEKIQVDSLEMIVTSADQRKIKKITVRRID